MSPYIIYTIIFLSGFIIGTIFAASLIHVLRIRAKKQKLEKEHPVIYLSDRQPKAKKNDNNRIQKRRV